MRYYTVSFLDSTGAPLSLGNGQPNQFSSYVNGKNIMGALDIEFDIYTNTYDQLAANSYLRMWGVGIPLLGQSNNLNGQTLKLEGGMQTGLPLANPKQAGLLVYANIFQAFGNWQGTEQTLDLILAYATPQPVNISFIWMQGQPIGPAIQNALKVAFPKATINVNVTQSIIASETQKAQYDNLTSFAQTVNQFTKDLIGGSYPGIWISYNGTTINVFDVNANSGTVDIAYTDLIGQPTWNNIAEISIKTVLRANINVGTIITLPQTPVINTAQSNSRFRNALDFSGNYKVTGIRHTGHYKQHDASSWATILTAIIIPNATAATQ